MPDLGAARLSLRPRQAPEKGQCRSGSHATLPVLLYDLLAADVEGTLVHVDD
jgi:hypothetical protein